MRSQVSTNATTWLEDTSTGNHGAASWSEDLAKGAAVDKALLGFLDAGGVVGKVNETKLAHDVEDLSAIFEQLEDGDVEFSLPCDDEDDVATAPAATLRQEHDEDWIEDLDQDAVNVEELSAAFDLLAEQVENADVDMTDDGAEAEAEAEAEAASSRASDNGSEDASESEEGDDEAVRIVPAAPTWVCGPPLDPRSVIRTPIFNNLDPRIPNVEIPRMDLGLGEAARCPNCPPGVPKTLCALPRVSARLSPRASPAKKDADEYQHDPATCWICKSDKSAFKKFALHRYLEKRRRRNWKRGPRYSGRSHVATNRVREGGRFVCTARWI
jgi:hypothetical protein